MKIWVMACSILLVIILLANSNISIPLGPSSDFMKDKAKTKNVVKVTLFDEKGAPIKGMLEDISILLIRADTKEEYVIRSADNAVLNDIPAGKYLLQASIMDMGGHYYKKASNIDITEGNNDLSLSIPGYNAHDPLMISDPSKQADFKGNVYLKAYILNGSSLPEKLSWVEAGEDLLLGRPSPLLLKAVDDNGVPVKGANITSIGNGRYISNSSGNILALFYREGLSLDIFKAEIGGLGSNEIRVRYSPLKGIILNGLAISNPCPSQFEAFEISCNIQNIGSELSTDTAGVGPVYIYPECKSREFLLKQPDKIFVRLNEKKHLTRSFHCEMPGEHIAIIGDKAIRFNVTSSETPGMVINGINGNIRLKAGEIKLLSVKDTSGKLVEGASVYVGSMFAGETDHNGTISLVFNDENKDPGYLVRILKDGYVAPDPVKVIVAGNGLCSLTSKGDAMISRNTSTVPSDSNRAIDMIFYDIAPVVWMGLIALCDIIEIARENWYVIAILLILFGILAYFSSRRKKLKDKDPFLYDPKY
jgi:hypothetical protein